MEERAGVRILPNGFSRFEPLNPVGTARCAYRAAFGGATVPPAMTRAGTSQRDVPTNVRFMERRSVLEKIKRFYQTSLPGPFPARSSRGVGEKRAAKFLSKTRDSSSLYYGFMAAKPRAGHNTRSLDTNTFEFRPQQPRYFGRGQPADLAVGGLLPPPQVPAGRQNFQLQTSEIYFPQGNTRRHTVSIRWRAET
jgi:hypothetical protein